MYVYMCIHACLFYKRQMWRKLQRRPQQPLLRQREHLRQRLVSKQRRFIYIQYNSIHFSWPVVKPNQSATLGGDVMLRFSFAQKQSCLQYGPPRLGTGSCRIRLLSLGPKNCYLVRENARLLLVRLEHVGDGAVAASSRRAAADTAYARARRSACREMRGPW